MNSVDHVRTNCYPARRTAQGGARSGTILVCVLACLVVTSALLANMIQTVLRDRREVRLERQLRQTELLCEAGVMRAADKLQSSSDYDGETWTPNLSQTPWSDASVEIRVTSVEGAAGKHVEVIAKLGHESGEVENNTQSMQRSHTFTFQPSDPSPSER